MNSQGYGYDNLDYDSESRAWELAYHDSLFGPLCEQAMKFGSCYHPTCLAVSGYYDGTLPVISYDTYSPTQGPLCEGFEERGYCGHESCPEVEEGLYEQYRRDQEHDCAYDTFLNDPITRAYGVGSEMVHLMSCKVCDRESPYTMLD